jgi:heat shock protein HslJ/membrane-bound inhibitor of C-type lysozyme
MQKLTISALLSAGLVLSGAGCDRTQPEADLEGAAEDQSTAQGSSGRQRYQCGYEVVLFTPSAEGDADLRIGSSSYAMQRVVSASGAKYENPGHPDTWFWDKGARAQLTVAGQRYEECKLLPGEETGESSRGGGGVLGIDWRLEDLDRTGIIDFSHLTLRLDEAGRVSGSGGCNQFSGGYSLNEGELKIGDNLAVTRKACAESLMDQEQRYLGLLPSMRRLALDETGALVLSSEEGQTLTFRIDE